MITIGEMIDWKQPIAYGILVCWGSHGQYLAARRMVMGRLKFRALKRIMEEPPRPGIAGLLTGEKAM